MREEDLHLGLGSKGWDTFRAVLNCKVQHNSNHQSPHSSYVSEKRIFIWLGFQQHWIFSIHRQERDLEKPVNQDILSTLQLFKEKPHGNHA